MNITNVEIKTASNGNQYKQVTFADKVYGKDRTNVFKDHPLYSQLNAGYDIPTDQLEVNQKGYLELKGGVSKKSSSQAPAFDNERLMRMEVTLQNINTHVMRLYKHAGIDKTPDYPEYKAEVNFDRPTDEFVRQEDVPF